MTWNDVVGPSALTQAHKKEWSNLHLIQQLAPWEPRPPADTPGVCASVCVRACVRVLHCLSQRGAGIHDVTTGSGPAVW